MRQMTVNKQSTNNGLGYKQRRTYLGQCQISMMELLVVNCCHKEAPSQMSDMVLNTPTAQEMKFSIKDFFSKCKKNPQFPADFVTFTEEILNGKLHFLCCDL